MTELRKQELRMELGVLGIWFLLLFGHPLGGLPDQVVSSNSNFIETNQIYLWKFELAEHTYLCTKRAPNIFNRLMQRLILGFKWKCLLLERN